MIYKKKEVYYTLPSYKQPRFWLSACNRDFFQKGLSFYQAYSTEARIKKALISCFYPALPYLLSKKKHSLDELLEQFQLVEIKEISKKYGFWGNLYKPRSEKLVVQLLKEDGSISAYLKISFSEQNNRWLKNEVEALNYLKSRGFNEFQYPEILDYEVLDGKSALLLSTPPRVDFCRRLDLGEILAGIRKLFNLDMRKVILKESLHYKDILERVKKSQYRDVLENILANVILHIENMEIPVGPTHFDFKPWNILKNEDSGKFFVIDWEFFKKEGLLLWDIFSFIIQPFLLLKYYRKSVTKITSKIGEYYSVFESCMDDCGMYHKKELKSFLTLYFLDMLTFFEFNGHRDRRTEHIIKKMLKIINSLAQVT